jgi:hypothetical protein
LRNPFHDFDARIGCCEKDMTVWAEAEWGRERKSEEGREGGREDQQQREKQEGQTERRAA